MEKLKFRNRKEAGKILASHLVHYAGRDDILVLGLAHEGVPVAYEVAHELTAHLEAFVVRPLAVPNHETVSMGAVASGGLHVLDRKVIERFEVSPATVRATLAEEKAEVERRDRFYRNSVRKLPIRARTVILIDDGVASTGLVGRALQTLRTARPSRVVLALPMGNVPALQRLDAAADEVVCAAPLDPLFGSGFHYADFSRTTDEEIQELLRDAATWEPTLQTRPAA